MHPDILPSPAGAVIVHNTRRELCGCLTLQSKPVNGSRRSPHLTGRRTDRSTALLQYVDQFMGQQVLLRRASKRNMVANCVGQGVYRVRRCCCFRICVDSN